MIQVLDKRVVRAYQPGRTPICGFLSYIDREAPVLLRRSGFEIGDDVHDDFTDEISHDNGVTWGEARPVLAKTAVDGGYLVYIEFASLFHEARNLLIVVTNQRFEASLAGCDLNSSGRLHITVTNLREPARDPEITVSDFGLPQGVMVSFTAPLLLSSGRVVVPIQWQKPIRNDQLGLDARTDMPGIFRDAWEPALLIGEFDSKGALQWRPGDSVPFDHSTTSRGLCEGTIAELGGGQLAMVLRGSNSVWHEKLACKWLTFSEDGGQSWSPAKPLACDDGSVIESAASGSALVRSIKNGKLYWIGNLCLNGERPIANFPRSPLVCAEVCEAPFALKRDSITVIDERTAEEGPQLQLSNFKYYQDRITEDLVVYLTRYGEYGQVEADWMQANQYAYRVAVD